VHGCDDLLDNLVGQGKHLITVRPSTFAVLALITNSNFAGCMTANLRAFRPSEFARSIAAE
jgi:hypothetical protein